MVRLLYSGGLQKDGGVLLSGPRTTSEISAILQNRSCGNLLPTTDYIGHREYLYFNHWMVKSNNILYEATSLEKAILSSRHLYLTRAFALLMEHNLH